MLPCTRSDRYPERTLELFALLELVTGAFGAGSPWLIRGVGAATVNSSVAVITVASFGLLLIPTTLMGATLPILVTHVVRTFRNLGVSAPPAFSFVLACYLVGIALGIALGKRLCAHTQNLYGAAAFMYREEWVRSQDRQHGGNLSSAVCCAVTVVPEVTCS